jgi:cysteine-rich repeat protein
MKKRAWVAIVPAALMFASCQMDDVNVSDFLNDLSVDQNGGDADGDIDGDVDTDVDGDTDTAFEGFCGDGMIQASLGESCDDGNTWWGDGCNEYCWVESGWVCYRPGMPCYYEGNLEYCGDGIVQPENGEECDSGGLDYGDGCTEWCVYEQSTCTFLDGELLPVGSAWSDGVETTCLCEAPGPLYCESAGGQECYFFGVYYPIGEIFAVYDSAYCQCMGENQVLCSSDMLYI